MSGGSAFLNGVNNGIRTHAYIQDRNYRKERNQVLDQRYDDQQALNQQRHDDQQARTSMLDARYNEQQTYNRGVDEQNRTRQAGLDEQKAQTDNLQRRIYQYNLAELKGKAADKHAQSLFNVTEAQRMLQEGQDDDINYEAAMAGLDVALQPLINVNPDYQSNIINMMPSEDGNGLHVELNVTDRDGNSKTAPMTLNRSSDPADKVVTIPWDMFYQSIDTMAKAMRDAGYDGSNQELRNMATNVILQGTGNKGYLNKKNAQAAQRQKLDDRMQKRVETYVAKAMKAQAENLSPGDPEFRDEEYFATQAVMQIEAAQKQIQKSRSNSIKKQGEPNPEAYRQIPSAMQQDSVKMPMLSNVGRVKQRKSQRGFQDPQLDKADRHRGKVVENQQGKKLFSFDGKWLEVTDQQAEALLNIGDGITDEQAEAILNG